MLKEFRDFIMTGNVIDFAVAIIMATALGAVINGFVNNIVMPIVGHYVGGVDFAAKKTVLDEAVVDAAGKVITPENAIMWGSWINTVINLIIVGFIMFLIVKAYNKSKAPAEDAGPAGPTTEELLTEIRDSLKK